MLNNYKKIPKFLSEADEREFWATHDSTEYVDWDSAEEVVLPNLKLSAARSDIFDAVYETVQDLDDAGVLTDGYKEFWSAVIEFRESVDWDEVGCDADIFEGVRDQSSGREENPWGYDQA